MDVVDVFEVDDELLSDAAAVLPLSLPSAFAAPDPFSLPLLPSRAC